MVTLKVIDKPIIAFYSSISGKQSYIKLGSMDTSAFEGGLNASSLIGTVNDTSWSMNVENFKMSGLSLSLDGYTELMLDPMVPFVYLPSKLWAQFATHM